MTFVLGLRGKALAGKDTMAEYLIREKGWDCTFSFAANLKHICQTVFHLSDDDVSSQSGKARLFRTPRVFSSGTLASIGAMMCVTHGDCFIPRENRELVESRFGTTLETPRRVLQFIGTDVCRALIPTYHVDVVGESIKRSGARLAVVTDVRFPNEGDYILKTLSGMVIEIDRPGVRAAGSDNSHSSELAMDGWPRYSDKIRNDIDGLPFFYEKIDTFLERNGL